MFNHHDVQDEAVQRGQFVVVCLLAWHRVPFYVYGRDSHFYTDAYLAFFVVFYGIETEMANKERLFHASYASIVGFFYVDTTIHVDLVHDTTIRDVRVDRRVLCFYEKPA